MVTGDELSRIDVLSLFLIQFIDAKVELLKFVKTFVNKLEKKVNPYALNIKVGPTFLLSCE